MHRHNPVPPSAHLHNHHTAFPCTALSFPVLFPSARSGFANIPASIQAVFSPRTRQPSFPYPPQAAPVPGLLPIPRHTVPVPESAQSHTVMGKQHGSGRYSCTPHGVLGLSSYFPVQTDTAPTFCRNYRNRPVLLGYFRYFPSYQNIPVFLGTAASSSGSSVVLGQR